MLLLLLLDSARGRWRSVLLHSACCPRAHGGRLLLLRWL
jgi:hypothetical protein